MLPVLPVPSVGTVADADAELAARWPPYDAETAVVHLRRVALGTFSKTLV